MKLGHSRRTLVSFAALWGFFAAGRPAAQTGPAPEPEIFDSAFFGGLKYRSIGPSRGGRVTAVAGVASEAGTFYLGATGGGVWKTTDFGQSWTNVSDGYFATGSIGAVRVAPSAPNIVYVGTGSDGIRSNVIAGRGVYRSNDAAKTWEFLGLRSVGQIGAVEVHPANPDIVFVAAIGHAFGPSPDRGVYRTRDGGKTWDQTLFLSERTGAVDLEFAPRDPETLYASMWRGERKPWTIISGGGEDGIYKSADGGATWKPLTNGLPAGVKGKSDLAVSPAAPDRVYVLLEAPEGKGGLYRSDDKGESFSLVSTYPPLLDRPFYYCNVDADPTNADVVYVNATSYFRSEDAGKTWRRLSTPHGDNHDMWINPSNPKIFIQSNDGGANVTLDGGLTWSTQNNQPTAELYQVAVDDQFPYWVYAGQQDNSTIMVPSLPPYAPALGPSAFWRAVGGCETGPAVPKPGNPDIVYANCKGCFGRYNKATGQEQLYWVGAANMYGHNPRDLVYRFQRVSPIHVSPHDPNVVYHASQFLHKTTDEGVTWETISPDLTAAEADKQVVSGEPITRDVTGEEFYSTIYAVQESRLEKGLIWVGANDGPVHVTRNGGKTWTNVTPKDMPKGGRIQTIEPSPHRAGKAYFAGYRYLLGDWSPYIYRTEDYGRTWKRIADGTNGIPADFPTRVVREDPDREGLLYAGTEFGMFISFDDGGTWQPFQLNLPVTPVTDIAVHRQDLVLSTMGRGFWILDNVTPLHQLRAGLTRSPARLFDPRPAYRMRYGTGSRSASDPQYPPPGVMLDYAFTGEPERAVKLEILSDGGTVLRTFGTGAGPQRLEAAPGMHRLTWDMRREAPAAAETGATPFPSRGRGPLVPPGFYRAKLTIGDTSREIRFEIRLDPRVAADGVTVEDLRAQEKLALEVLALQVQARETEGRLEKERKILAEPIARGGDAARKAKAADQKLAAIRAKLVTAGGRYPRPMLLDQIGYLARMLDGADQKPGRDAFRRLEELRAAIDLISKEIDSVLKILTRPGRDPSWLGSRRDGR